MRPNLNSAWLVDLIWKHVHNSCFWHDLLDKIFCNTLTSPFDHPGSHQGWFRSKIEQISWQIWNLRGLFSIETYAYEVFGKIMLSSRMILGGSWTPSRMIPEQDWSNPRSCRIFPSSRSWNCLSSLSLTKAIPRGWRKTGKFFTPLCTGQFLYLVRLKNWWIDWGIEENARLLF